MTNEINTFLCNSTDDYLSKAYSHFKASGTTDSLDVSAVKTAVNVLTTEETVSGVFTNIVNLPMYMLADVDDDQCAKFANFIHDTSRTAVRECRVTCALADDLAVGMPILILDGDFSIYGVLQGVSYNVDSNGTVRSNLEILHPKLIMTDDYLPNPPMWLSYEKMRPWNIGDVYEEMFGCSSIYINDAQAGAKEASINDTQILRNSIRYWIGQYEDAKDKAIFTEKFRERKSQVTMTDLFENMYSCTPKKASKYSNEKEDETSDVIAWLGVPFQTYKGYGNVPGAPEHAAVNKQEIVWDFVRAYYSKPGLMVK